jgi:hypothetical protein
MHLQDVSDDVMQQGLFLFLFFAKNRPIKVFACANAAMARSGEANFRTRAL